MLTQAEVRESVERAERRFIDSCATTTHDQWRFQPSGPGDRGWTIPQIVEHVTGANDGLVRVLQAAVVTSRRGDQLPDFEDEDMPYIFYGGGGAAPPDWKTPTGAITSKSESLAAFQASTRAILDCYDSIDIDLRECARVHPAFGLFDGAQWFLFAAVHMQQHRGQILDVKLASDKAAADTAAI